VVEKHWSNNCVSVLKTTVFEALKYLREKKCQFLEKRNFCIFQSFQFAHICAQKILTSSVKKKVIVDEKIIFFASNYLTSIFFLFFKFFIYNFIKKFSKLILNLNILKKTLSFKFCSDFMNEFFSERKKYFFKFCCVGCGIKKFGLSACISIFLSKCWKFLSGR